MTVISFIQPEVWSVEEENWDSSITKHKDITTKTNKPTLEEVYSLLFGSSRKDLLNVTTIDYTNNDSIVVTTAWVAYKLTRKK